MGDTERTVRCIQGYSVWVAMLDEENRHHPDFSGFETQEKSAAMTREEEARDWNLFSHKMKPPAKTKVPAGGRD